MSVESTVGLHSMGFRVGRIGWRLDRRGLFCPLFWCWNDYVGVLCDSKKIGITLSATEYNTVASEDKEWLICMLHLRNLRLPV